MSEWMYCTDLDSLVCGDVDEAGNLVEEDYEDIPLNGMTELNANPRLTQDQMRVIAYLIQNGHSYAGVGAQEWGGVTWADGGPESTTNSRAALQSLIWCVSDPFDDGATADLAQTCAANMDADEQAAILAQVPADPTLTLTADQAEVELESGESATFTLTTNLLEQDITLTIPTGANVTVCNGDAELAGDVLTVHGTGSQTVELCLGATEAGSYELAAAATPASLLSMRWRQSQDNAELTAAVMADQPNRRSYDCQVFGTFDEAAAAELTAMAAVEFVEAEEETEDPTTDPTTEPTEESSEATETTSGAATSAESSSTSGGGSDLAETGADLSLVALVLSGSLVLVGAALLAIRRRRAL